MNLRRFPLLVAGAAAVAFALPASPAPASTTQFSIFEAPREMGGDDDAARQQTLDEIKAFGVTHMRVLIYWNSVVTSGEEKSKPAGFDSADPNSDGYNWARIDTIFAEAAERGIQIIPTITGPVPIWATAAKRNHLNKPDRDEFAKFVQAVGTRYKDQVGMWTIWNEPNQPQFLGPQFVNKKPYSPFLYRNLYQAAIEGLGKSGNGADKVLAGETSPRGNENIVPPVTFAKLFLKGKKLPMDGYAHHPYTTSAGPFYKPKSVDVTIGVLGRLTKVLDKYSKHPKLGLYLTEFGIQSKPDPVAGVTQPRQNDYRNISEKIAYDNPRVRAFSQYLMRDDKPGKGVEKYGGFESGLKLANGTPKLAFDGYRLPMVAKQQGKKVKLWGLVRPAEKAVTVRLQQRDPGGAWRSARNARTNSRGYWTKSATYKKGRTFRVLWTAFKSPPAHIY